jgi:hypothetical protein
MFPQRFIISGVLFFLICIILPAERQNLCFAFTTGANATCPCRLPYSEQCSGSFPTIFYPFLRVAPGHARSGRIEPGPARSGYVPLFERKIQKKYKLPSLKYVFRLLGHGECINETCKCIFGWTGKSFFYAGTDCATSEVAAQVVNLLTYACAVLTTLICCWRILTLKPYILTCGESKTRGKTRARKHVIRITLSSLFVALSTHCSHSKIFSYNYSI